MCGERVVGGNQGAVRRVEHNTQEGRRACRRISLAFYDAAGTFTATLKIRSAVFNGVVFSIRKALL